MRAALTIIAVVALLAVVAVALIAWRLRSLVGRVGSFQCSLRTGSHWMPGVMSYTREALEWYEMVSLSRRPRHRWPRDGFVIESRQLRPVRDGTVMQAQCRHDEVSFDLAAAPAAFEGIVSWLEAAPPGPMGRGVI